MKLLLLDAGHAKNTPGKNNAKENFYEWEFNDSMQYAIKKRAEEHGIHVFLSNPSPSSVSDISLSTRANLMNNYWKSKGKPEALAISIHANAYSNSSARGTETFIASNASFKSKNFAKDLNNEIVKAFKLLDDDSKDRGVKIEDFTVIYKTLTPTCLIEYGFYSNKDDLSILKNNRNDLVEATVRAICRYFNIRYKIVVSEAKKYKNAILYKGEIDKSIATCMSFYLEDCIVKDVKNHIKWTSQNLFVVGGACNDFNSEEKFSKIIGSDRKETHEKMLKKIGKI